MGFLSFALLLLTDFLRCSKHLLQRGAILDEQRNSLVQLGKVSIQNMVSANLNDKLLLELLNF